MDITKYKQLPDSLTPDETHKLFRELLAIEEPQTPEDAVALANAFDEVADRQWHTYTLLDDATRNDVDAWIIRHWDRNSLELAQVLTCVIGKVGLVNSAEMLRRELDCEMPASVRKEIEQALQEFGSTVADPYSGMKNLGR